MAPPAAPASLPALVHGLPLLPRLPGSRRVGDLAPPSGGDAARAGGPRSDPLGRHPRHPERQDHGKGGARGFDAAKKVKGRKRHIAVGTSGFLLGVLVHATDIQDADSAGALLTRIKQLYCWLRAVFADSIYNRMPVILACFLLGLTLIIVRRIAGGGFILVPRRWVVERSFGWLGRWRRLSKDYEERTGVAEAMITVTAIRIMLHRPAHPNRKRLPSPSF
ncbi:transposase [Azospirillum argentinense]|uniref:Transposase n=2 Tax=Azospirillum argentinense TaxID=2970906 RepID=A0ABW8VHJ0_9PROT